MDIVLQGRVYSLFYSQLHSKKKEHTAGNVLSLKLERWVSYKYSLVQGLGQNLAQRRSLVMNFTFSSSSFVYICNLQEVFSKFQEWQESEPLLLFRPRVSHVIIYPGTIRPWNHHVFVCSQSVNLWVQSLMICKFLSILIIYHLRLPSSFSPLWHFMAIARGSKS